VCFPNATGRYIELPKKRVLLGGLDGNFSSSRLVVIIPRRFIREFGMDGESVPFRTEIGTLQDTW